MTSTEAHQPTDIAAVRVTIDAYLEWSRTGTAEALRRAFHPQATVVNASNGDDAVVPWTLQAFADGVEALRQQHGTVEETARSVTIDIAGNIAGARIDFDLQIGDQHHTGTDYLILARTGKRWLITQKGYHSDKPYKPADS